MTCVVSDTSVLCYLAQLGHLPLLESLFGTIVVPDAVRSECVHSGAPSSLREWFSPSPPAFVETITVTDFLPTTAALDAGEASAITLAWSRRPDSLLLLDEKRGRAVAQSLGLNFRGVLGIIMEGHRRALLDFDAAMLKLRQLGFRIADPLLQAARSELGLTAQSTPPAP